MKYELDGIKATHLFNHRNEGVAFTLAWSSKTKQYFSVAKSGKALGEWSVWKYTERELNDYGWFGKKINLQLENK